MAFIFQNFMKCWQFSYASYPSTLMSVIWWCFFRHLEKIQVKFIVFCVFRIAKAKEWVQITFTFPTQCTPIRAYEITKWSTQTPIFCLPHPLHTFTFIKHTKHFTYARRWWHRFNPFISSAACLCVSVFVQLCSILTIYQWISFFSRRLFLSNTWLDLE